MTPIAAHGVPEARAVNRDRTLAHLVGFLGANLVVGPTALILLALITGAPRYAPPPLIAAAAEILGIMALAIGARIIARTSP